MCRHCARTSDLQCLARADWGGEAPRVLAAVKTPSGDFKPFEVAIVFDFGAGHVLYPIVRPASDCGWLMSMGRTARGLCQFRVTCASAASICTVQRACWPFSAVDCLPQNAARIRDLDYGFVRDICGQGTPTTAVANSPARFPDPLHGRCALGSLRRRLGRSPGEALSGQVMP